MVSMSEMDDWSSLAFDADGRLVDLSNPQIVTWDPPTPGKPVPVVDLPSVLGRRLVLMRNDGPVFDHRAAGEVFTDEQGSWIHVVTEAQWYRWSERPADKRPPQCPRATVWSTRNVYAEVYAV